MKKYDLDDLLNELPPKRAEVPAGLYDKILQRKKQTREIKLSPWSYAAAACIVLLNGLGIFYAWQQQSSEQESASTEQMATSYNWNSTDYYNY